MGHLDKKLLGLNPNGNMAPVEKKPARLEPLILKKRPPKISNYTGPSNLDLVRLERANLTVRVCLLSRGYFVTKTFAI